MQKSELLAMLDDARSRTLALVEDLSDAQRMGPRLDIVNPLLWEIGHIAWFHEKWTLRDLDGRAPQRDDADALYDSIAIPHDTRWDLPLPDYAGTLDYMESVQRAMEERFVQREPSEEEIYRYRYTTHHEDMHAEAFTYTRQTLGYPAPNMAIPGVEPVESGPLPGDVEVPGGTYLLGAGREQGFAFDNEKWAHPVELEPFAIARAPVTNAEYRRFVDDDGYGRREFWSDEGWAWRASREAEHPVYWRRSGDSWQVRHFEDWRALPPHRPVAHVNWYEADAYSRWADRRLPTEAEWEAAASASAAPDGELSDEKRLFPWGDAPPTPERANLGGVRGGTVDVAALGAGESAFGCRQMIGNVWEWTSSDFLPYPGFVRDFYEEYSEPWFGDRKVLRGGCWATRTRMVRNPLRNYFTPERRDVFAGFRTCRIDQRKPR